MRKATSLTISSDILNEIALTKGTGSTSERVNNLLKRALESERRERIEREAAEFFAAENGASARERAAFRKAAKRVLSRD
jgi:hypothetical protein